MKFKAMWARALAIAALSAAVHVGTAHASSNEVIFDVSGILDMDERGAESNTVKEVFVGAKATIESLTWDISLTSHDPSYLSEMQVTFSDSLGNGVTFTPGGGDDFEGTSHYAGFQDLRTLGQQFQLGADGMLRLEFHDAYKDRVFDEPEGTWNFGTLTFGVSAVPEPQTAALLIAGLLAIHLVRRRRSPAPPSASRASELSSRHPSGIKVFQDSSNASAALLPASARVRGWVAGVAVISLASGLASPHASAEPIFEIAKPVPLYSYYAVGDVNAPVTAPASRPTPSFVLMGGGPDVDAAFRWLVQRAGITPGSGGRFVVIRASGSDAYNPYIFYSDENLSTSSAVADQWVGGASLGLTSVETLVIPSVKAANSAAVNAIVAKANVVFVAGGDQGQYVRFWKGTALEKTLQALMQRNVPVGGTSAGLAVLGQFDYSALYNSATSEHAMADPYDRDITFDPSPLSLTGGFITPPALESLILDSHFDSRDRMGRLVTFISRIVATAPRPGGTSGCSGGVLPAASSGNKTARGIGIDVETALLVQGNGEGYPVTATRVTNPSTTTESAVYFVRPSVPPTVCMPLTPLSIATVEVRKLKDSSSVFNLTDWTGIPLYRYVDVNAGQLLPADWY